MARRGAKKRPFYNIVVTDSRTRRDGRFIERLGFYNPISQGDEVPFCLNKERLAHWRNVGAQLSDGFAAILKKYHQAQ